MEIAVPIKIFKIYQDCAIVHSLYIRWATQMLVNGVPAQLS